jgi:hypothetical protein
MSEVISFRLNPHNPREAKALDVLEIKMVEGYSIRQIITEALIHSACQKHNQDWTNDETNLQSTLVEISKFLQQWNDKNIKKVETDVEFVEHEDLANSFISSVKLNIKPGLKIP